MQKPPMYSAIKIQGKRSHKMARRGEKVELNPREIQIFSLEILSYEYPLLSLRVHCSAGTYIRSIARDLGEILHCGGYLHSLRRTVCGSFKVEDAFSLERLTPLSLISLEEILKDHPKIVLPESCWERIRNKQRIPVKENAGDRPLLWIDGEIVALGKRENGFVVSETILVPDLKKDKKKSIENKKTCQTF